MASKEPPIIRSSKAFSVEIPEGSSSAKSKTSDVVAGLEEGISPSDPHFEASSMLSEQDHVSENELLHDTFVKISSDPQSRHSNSTFTQESMSDHSVGVSDDGLQDHFVGLPQDNLVDNHASLPDDAIEDRVEAVAEPEVPIPLFVNADDDFPDDHMEIEYPPDVDPNVQALSDEALVDHAEQIKEDSVVRAQVDFPHENAVAQEPAKTKPAPQPQALVKKSPQLLTPDMIKQHEAELVARQLRKEEFHGRVDAIRKTVQDINAKLDQITPDSKATSH